MKKLLLLLIFAGAVDGNHAMARPASDRLDRLIEAWQIDAAAEELSALGKAKASDPDIAMASAAIKFQQGQYEEAAAEYRELLPKLKSPRASAEVKEMLSLAQATAEVTHGFVSTPSPKGHFIFHYAPGKDALLIPYAGEALDKAYDALNRDFDDRPSSPVRVEIYGDISDLAKVSTLTLQEIETSGTIALCKFNRLMIVSPRALLAGYPWIDTLNHEYTHFVVSRISFNTVPIWLHEGLAKYEERRWRNAEGGAMPPSAENLLAGALAKKHFITFAEMYPSMAKLPSQEDAALAFAEVESAIEYLHEKIGWEGVRAIIADLKSGMRDAQAIEKETKRSFEDFQHDWRTWLAGRNLKTHPGLIPTELKFKHAEKQGEEDAGQIKEEKARKLARLGGMLRARHRLRAAASEYEKAQALVGVGHPLVASKLARTYLELDDAARAIEAAIPALALYPELSGPNATLGEAYLKNGDLKKAVEYLLAANAINPFDPAVHCGLEKIFRQGGEARAEQEGLACRELGN